MQLIAAMRDTRSNRFKKWAAVVNSTAFNRSIRLPAPGILAIIVALNAPIVLLAQATARAPKTDDSTVSAPFVGCKSDGQVGPVEAPEHADGSVPSIPEKTSGLAYYKSAQGIGVIAPRGWYCFGTYGSGSDTLYVTREPMDPKERFSATPKIAGAAIQISHIFGDTSGRFTVAGIMARVFPAYKPFVLSVIETFDQPPSSFPFGPYPTDTLTYKGKTVVEYTTPARTDGLGTHSWFEKNDRPIRGVAILFGPTPDLLLLAVRLPPELDGIASTIIRQVEREFADSRSN